MIDLLAARLLATGVLPIKFEEGSGQQSFRLEKAARVKRCQKRGARGSSFDRWTTFDVAFSACFGGWKERENFSMRGDDDGMCSLLRLAQSSCDGYREGARTRRA